ncbi:hypothetical protein ACFONI_22610 [Aeromonas media]|uniref:hypothetical protein n=1 Tax=Aeromonas media TaxID=651 RepID=UPI003611E6A0
MPAASPFPAGWPDAAICRNQASRSNPHPLPAGRTLLSAATRPAVLIPIPCRLAGRCYLPQPGQPFLSPSPAGWPDAAICRSRASRSNPHPLLVERALLHASGNPIR